MMASVHPSREGDHVVRSADAVGRGRATVGPKHGTGTGAGIPVLHRSCQQTARLGLASRAATTAFRAVLEGRLLALSTALMGRFLPELARPVALASAGRDFSCLPDFAREPPHQRADRRSASSSRASRLHVRSTSVTCTIGGGGFARAQETFAIEANHCRQPAGRCGQPGQARRAARRLAVALANIPPQASQHPQVVRRSRSGCAMRYCCRALCRRAGTVPRPGGYMVDTQNAQVLDHPISG